MTIKENNDYEKEINTLNNKDKVKDNAGKALSNEDNASVSGDSETSKVSVLPKFKESSYR